MAPESIQTRRYSLKSDVYAYGTLLWEMWSNGAFPFMFESNEADLARRSVRPFLCLNMPSQTGCLLVSILPLSPRVGLSVPSRPSVCEPMSVFSSRVRLPLLRAYMCLSTCRDGGCPCCCPQKWLSLMHTQPYHACCDLGTPCCKVPEPQHQCLVMVMSSDQTNDWTGLHQHQHHVSHDDPHHLNVCKARVLKCVAIVCAR